MTRIRKVIPFTALLIAAPALFSCERKAQDETDQPGKVVEQPATTDEEPMMGEEPASPEPAETAGMIDASTQQVLQDIHKTNLAEVKMADLAIERQVRPEVQELAQRLKKEHSQSNQQLQSLSQQMNLNLDLESEDLSQDAEQAMSQLEASKGNEFEQTFVQTQIQMHEQKIDSLKNALAQVENVEARQYVQTTIQDLEEHLKLARDIQSKMGEGGSTMGNQ